MEINHEKKIDDLLLVFRSQCLSKLHSAKVSGMVPENLFTEDNYVLAKAIVDSCMRDRPFYLPGYRGNFDNIHRI
jgi:hypothetical protein